MALTPQVHGCPGCLQASQNAACLKARVLDHENTSLHLGVFEEAFQQPSSLRGIYSPTRRPVPAPLSWWLGIMGDLAQYVLVLRGD